MGNKKFSNFQIRWGEQVGPEDCQYLKRWVLVMFGYALRLHHWTNSDDPRHFHDHPWWMVILVLRGGYVDISPDGEDRLSLGSLRFRKADHKHTVRVDDGGCWSLLLTGPKSRKWGFWIKGRNVLLRPLRYFSRFGHHQCD